jgi:hypothetical protein
MGANSDTAQKYSRSVRFEGTSSVHDICVEDALLFKIVRDGVLGEEWGLEFDFGADPFAFGMRSVGRVIATAAAAELGAEVGGLDLVELLDVAPGFVGDGARDVDF